MGIPGEVVSHNSQCKCYNSVVEAGHSCYLPSRHQGKRTAAAARLTELRVNDFQFTIGVTGMYEAEGGNEEDTNGVFEWVRYM